MLLLIQEKNLKTKENLQNIMFQLLNVSQYIWFILFRFLTFIFINIELKIYVNIYFKKMINPE